MLDIERKGLKFAIVSDKLGHFECFIYLNFDFFFDRIIDHFCQIVRFFIDELLHVLPDLVHGESCVLGCDCDDVSLFHVRVLLALLFYHF